MLFVVDFGFVFFSGKNVIVIKLIVECEYCG